MNSALFPFLSPSARARSFVFLMLAAVAFPIGVSAEVTAVYDESFTQGQEAPAQAKQDWINFRTSLTPSAYDTVTIRGTFDPVGRTLSDAMIVPQIAAALKNATGGSWTAGGFTWNVGTCGSEPAVLSANAIGDQASCACEDPGYLVRPNIGTGNANWGGVNTATCNGPSQTIIVIFSGPSCTPDYSVTQTSGAAIVPGTTDTGNHCDDCTTNITLPFPVTFYDQVFASANVSSNGLFEFTSNLVACCGGCLPANFLSDVISPFWADLLTSGNSNSGGGPANGIFTSISGSAPNRIFNIEWRTLSRPVANQNQNNFEIRLYEGQTRIDLVYGTITGGNGSDGIGLQRDTGSDFTSISCGNRPASGTQYTFTTCTPPPANMVSWWPGDGDGLDIVSANDLSFFGGSAFVPGEVGQAFNFTGGQAASPGLPANLNITGNQVTIDGWVNPNVNNPQGVFFGKSESGLNDYALFILSGQLASCIKTNNGVEHFLFSGGYFPPTGQWTHIAMTYDGTTETLYANGVAIAQQPVSGNIQGDGVNFWIGGRSFGFDLTINAAIDEVEVFDRALLPEEIAAIYNAGAAGKCKPTGGLTLTTTASAATVVGGSVSDTAILSGGCNNPTGSITFNLYGPNDPMCGNTPVFTSTVTVNGDGSYMSDPYTATAAGTYYWVASYSGDSSNGAVSGNCGDPNESVVVNPLPTADCVTISGAVQGFAITPVTMVGSLGLGGPYTFSATGLPDGLGISSSGTISGTPTVNGTFNYTVTVTDAAGNNGTVNCSVTVNPPPATNCVTISGAVQGYAITSVTMVGSGGVGGPYAFSATGLPNGLGISSSGTISGTPTVNGTFNYTVTVSDSAGNSAMVNCSVIVRPPVSSSCLTINAVQGTAITPVTMTGSGGLGGPYTFSATGLPNGLGISSSGTISGTPTVNGMFNYTVTVTDVASHSGMVNCSVTVSKATPTVTTTASANTTLGNGVSDTATVSGGFHPTGTVTFRLFGPNDMTCMLPPIFTITKTIDTSGNASSGSFTPTLPGTYVFVATYNGDGNNFSTSRDNGNETVVVSGVEADGNGAIGGVTFSFSDEMPGKKGPKFLNYSDASCPVSFSTGKISALTIFGSHASFTGTAKVGKKGTVSFTVQVDENGPGTSDHFSITLSNGCSASGNLTSGNIMFH